MNPQEAQHARVQPVKTERGIVLVLVLWILVLLTVLAASFVSSSNSEGLQARYLMNTTRARYAAEAGLHRAVYELKNPIQDTRWRADGRPYEIEFEDAKVTIEIIDESGKIDLNNADPALLTALFTSVGVQDLDAKKLAGAVIDWRDFDDVPQQPGAEKSDYKGAGLNYGPTNKSFQTVSELQQVIGMNYEIYQKLEEAVTINSFGQPNPAFAQAEVLRALFRAQGCTATDAQIEGFIEARKLTALGQQITTPCGQPILPQGQGVTYTIKTRAEFPGGAKARLQATVQLGPGTVGSRPFRLVRWREGTSS
jgi:general secretion pathway protein K